MAISRRHGLTYQEPYTKHIPAQELKMNRDISKEDQHEAIECLKRLSLFPVKNSYQLQGSITPYLQLRSNYVTPKERWWEAVFDGPLANIEESLAFRDFLEHFNGKDAIPLRVLRATSEIMYEYEAGTNYLLRILYDKSSGQTKLAGLRYLLNVSTPSSQEGQTAAEKTVLEGSGRSNSTDLLAQKPKEETERLRCKTGSLEDDPSFWKLSSSANEHDAVDKNQPKEVSPDRRLVTPMRDFNGLAELVIEQTGSLWKACRRNQMNVDEFLRLIRTGLENARR
ncbi:hypothetical protein SJAG_00736 [Schizosaccharomyces japonicus yFS275]|uniref:Uncharacterized protein n=1 Tax=Schizosaccharomyces japonicus (strain yFS275 / FY16936) TaxID=402676 RepID=B6JWG0_SCHJY|nr:hypothetical protein SJAG_00736 [Schizosaccharomyces japonicus yFS275]EEB05711.2 hypothetical protein SJAG_00736 [Schizosaccharomyces japonicus yFS275]